MARELLVIAFRDLGLRRVDADAYTDNVASNQVLTRIGMRLEGTIRAHSLGKDGRWLDANLWAVLREEWAG